MLNLNVDLTNERDKVISGRKQFTEGNVHKKPMLNDWQGRRRQTAVYGYFCWRSLVAHADIFYRRKSRRDSVRESTSILGMVKSQYDRPVKIFHLLY